MSPREIWTGLHSGAISRQLAEVLKTIYRLVLWV